MIDFDNNQKLKALSRVFPRTENDYFTIQEKKIFEEPSAVMVQNKKILNYRCKTGGYRLILFYFWDNAIELFLEKNGKFKRTDTIDTTRLPLIPYVTPKQGIVCDERKNKIFFQSVSSFHKIDFYTKNASFRTSYHSHESSFFSS